MAAGFIPTKAALDQRAAAIVVAGQSWLDDVARLKAWLDTQSDQDLADLGLGEADIIEHRNSATALDNLRKAATAQGTIPAVDDFFFWGKRLRKFL